MSSSECPLPLESGELLLQWFVPSTRGRMTVALRRSRRWSVVLSAASVILGTFLILCGGGLHPVVGLVAAVGTIAAAITGYVAPIAWQWRTPPVRWWVTTRRLITDEGDTPRVRRLDTLKDLDVCPPYAIDLTVDDADQRLAPVDALPELWGALLLGRALCAVDFPEVDPEAESPRVPATVCWDAVERQGQTTRTGALVLRRDCQAWIPAIATTLKSRAGALAAGLAGATLGARVRVVRPNPPVGVLLHRMLRLRDPAGFDALLDAVTHAWGGFVTHGPDAVTAEGGRKGIEVSVTAGERIVCAKGVDAHPDWPEVSAALGLRDGTSASTAA